MRTARSAALAALSLFVVLTFMGGCGGSVEDREERLRAGGMSILPTDAKVLDLSYGDCVEFSASPSCVTILFSIAGDPEARAEALVGRARDNGWIGRAVREPFGTFAASFRRGDQTASVSIWSPEWRRECLTAPGTVCDREDSLQVQEEF